MKRKALLPVYLSTALCLLVSASTEAQKSKEAMRSVGLSVYQQTAFHEYVREGMGKSRRQADYWIGQSVRGSEVLVSISPKRHEANVVGGVSRYGSSVTITFRNGSKKLIKKEIAT
jgi:hypothetical protein